MNLQRLLLAFSVLGLGASALAEDALDLPWELKRDRDGIAIYTAVVPDSKHKAVRSVMMLEGVRLSELTALVRDPDACPDWADLCKRAEVVETVSETEMYVYTLNDLPWPVTDRDAIAHVRWAQDAETGAVTMRASLVPDKLPVTDGTIRIQYGETSWTFMPQDDGRVEVASFAHIDPSGATPAWLTNRLLVDSPHTTNTAMRAIIDSDRYDNASFNFITEP